MSKKMFVLIVLLMSISLIGIIAVQLYWINNAVESKKEQFKNDLIFCDDIREDDGTIN